MSSKAARWFSLFGAGGGGVRRKSLFAVGAGLLITGAGIVVGYQSLRTYCNGPMVGNRIMERADLKNKVIVITGVSPNGIGYETCKVLLEKNGTIIIGVRDLKKGEATRKEILEHALANNNNLQGNIHVLQLDLNDLDSVKHFSDEIKEKFNRCDMLINNAGISDYPHALSKQNVEIQFAVNHLSHFLLTNLLLDRLKYSKGRVISVASRAHENYYGQSFKLDDVYNNSCHYMYCHYLYARSKFANVLFAKKLDRILKEQYSTTTSTTTATTTLDKGIIDGNLNDRCISVSLHPGLVASNIGRYSTLMRAVLVTVGKVFGKDLVHGAQTTLHLALADKEELRGGSYYSDCKEKECNPLANRVDIQDELWETSKVLCSKYLLEK